MQVGHEHLQFQLTFFWFEMLLTLSGEKKKSFISAPISSKINEFHSEHDLLIEDDTATTPWNSAFAHWERIKVHQNQNPWNAAQQLLTLVQ